MGESKNHIKGFIILYLLEAYLGERRTLEYKYSQEHVMYMYMYILLLQYMSDHRGEVDHPIGAIGDHLMCMTLWLQVQCMCFDH